MSETRTGPNQLRVIAVLCFFAYGVVASGTLNVFPFSTFEMYSQVSVTTGSRVIVRDADGEAHEVKRYVDWSCEGPLNIDAERCMVRYPPFYFIPYKDAEVEAHIRAHPGEGDGTQPLTLVRRIWRLEHSNGPISYEDCELHTCRARRK